jgi:hypothetical protein
VIEPRAVAVVKTSRQPIKKTRLTKGTRLRYGIFHVFKMIS